MFLLWCKVIIIKCQVKCGIVVVTLESSQAKRFWEGLMGSRGGYFVLNRGQGVFHGYMRGVKGYFMLCGWGRVL